MIITSGVIFAYAAVELVGTAAGETENPAKVMPRAINSVIFRIAVFYVGSLILLALLLPYTAYKQGRPSSCSAPRTPVTRRWYLVAVTALMCYENYWNLVALLVIVPALVAGWYAVRGRVLEIAAERVGITGNYPVVAETPLMDEFLDKDNERRD